MCIIPVKFQNMLICSFASKLHVFAHKTHTMLFYTCIVMYGILILFSTLGTKTCYWSLPSMKFQYFSICSSSKIVFLLHLAWKSQKFWIFPINFFPVQNSIFALLCILILHTCMVTYAMSSMFLHVHTSKMYYVCHHILAL